MVIPSWQTKVDNVAATEELRLLQYDRARRVCKGRGDNGRHRGMSTRQLNMEEPSISDPSEGSLKT